MHFLVIKPLLVFKWLESILLLLSLFLFTTQSKAQSPPLVFRNFSVNDGLSHNFVRCFLQDSRGFMWIATIDGLNKFDGYTFKTYKVKHDDTTSLSSNNVSALTEDLYGNIWAGTWGEAFVSTTGSSTISNALASIQGIKHTQGFPQNSFMFCIGIQKTGFGLAPLMQ